MNLTITHRHADRPASAAAVTAVVAAAVRAGHTITITTDSHRSRYTFALDDHHVIISTDQPELADGAEPPGWAVGLATAAVRLI
jgi:hypothetical protein